MTQAVNKLLIQATNALKSLDGFLQVSTKVLKEMVKEYKEKEKY